VIEYNPKDPDIITNPYPCYESLRQTDPYHWSKLLDRWIFTRYADVANLLKDSRLSSNRTRNAGLFKNSTKESHPIERFISLWLLTSDAPEHTRLRSAVQHAFLPRLVEKMRDHIKDVTLELIE